MSKLQELIRELCPNGVEYKALGELGTSQKGVRVVRKQLEESGPFPVYQNSLTPLGYYEESNRSAGMPFVIGAGAAAQIGYSDAEWWAADDCFTFDIPQDVAVGRFVYYCLLNQQEFLKSRIRKASIPRLARSVVEKLHIPVPPIEVQREVVRILDEYTAAHDELVKQLEEEIRLRERQHGDMRQALFDGCGGDTKTLGELFPFIRNGFVGTVSNHFSDREHGVRYLEGTNIHDGHISDNEEIYVTREFHEAHLRSELKPTDIVVVQSGHVGECAVVGEKYAGGNCHALIVMSNGGQCVSQFVVQYLYSKEGRRQLDKMTTGGTVKHILASKIGKISLPLPTEPQQRMIVATIAEMDRSYRELVSSLREELCAHKLQLALVRNQLLSFPEKVA